MQTVRYGDFLAAASLHGVGDRLDKTGETVFAVANRRKNRVDLSLSRWRTGDKAPFVFRRTIGQRTAFGSEPFKAEA